MSLDDNRVMENQTVTLNELQWQSVLKQLSIRVRLLTVASRDARYTAVDRDSILVQAQILDDICEAIDRQLTEPTASRKA